MRMNPFLDGSELWRGCGGRQRAESVAKCGEGRERPPLDRADLGAGRPAAIRLAPSGLFDVEMGEPLTRVVATFESQKTGSPTG